MACSIVATNVHHPSVLGGTSTLLRIAQHALLAVLIPCPEIRCLSLARTGVGIAQMLISAGQASEPPVPGRWVVIWASTQRFLASGLCPLPCTASKCKGLGEGHLAGQEVGPSPRVRGAVGIN